VPAAQHLIAAATLVVHPQFTTRAKTEQDLLASNNALQFLYQVLNIFGPLGARFSDVFAFKSRVQTRRKINSQTFLDESEPSQLVSPFVKEQSVFTQTEDFWSIVGWAFNTSTLWPKRWARWKLWLNLMLDVIDADFDARMSLASTETTSLKSGVSMAESILQAPDGRTSRRRFMRAILARASEKSQNEFGEVFLNETKERKVKDETVRRRTLNLEQDQCGDYDADLDEDEVMEDVQSEARDSEEDGSSSESDKEEEAVVQMDVIKLQQRFLVLVGYTLG
jgi:hypothetical protein